MIFWKSWSWPSSSRECLVNRLRWHLVAETGSSNVKLPKSAKMYFRIWMRRQVGTVHWSCLSAPTDSGISHLSGFQIQNTVKTGHCSQLRMNGRLSSMSWRYPGHPDIGLGGCQRAIQSHCITVSKCTMTCSITWMGWSKPWPRRRINGRNTCPLLWN